MQNTTNTKFLEALFQYATLGILAVEQNGVIRRVNPFAEKLFGYSKGNLVGKKMECLLPHALRTKHVHLRENYHQKPTPRVMGANLELFGLKKDGTQFPVKISLSYVQIDDEALAIAFVSDDSLQRQYSKELEKTVHERTKELKASEAKLRTALLKEKELGELKSRFVSMASHEFRTPLSSILGSAELIPMYDQTNQQDKREKHTRRIVSAVSNLNGILNDFLSLEKLESGKVNLQFQIIQLQELSLEVIEQMTPLTKKDQKIQLEFSGNPEFRTDPFLLKNILINLLSNAVKYSTTDILLQVHKEEKTLKIKVQDWGIGIPKSDQVHLFSRFFRATNAINIKGTGLGLTIIRRYIGLLNGDIYFESKENKGTSFFVEIPERSE